MLYTIPLIYHMPGRTWSESKALYTIFRWQDNVHSELTRFWTLSIARNSKYKETHHFGNRATCSVEKPGNSACYTPLSEPFTFSIMYTSHQMLFCITNTRSYRELFITTSFIYSKNRISRQCSTLRLDLYLTMNISYVCPECKSTLSSELTP
jgi:hypothetical protein